MQAFWKVIIPEIKPGIISGALIAFTMSIDDFIISYFTAGSGVSTLAMTIYSMTKKRVSPEINAISTLLFGAVLAAAHHHQCPGIPAGAPAGASPRMTIGPTACGS